VINITIEAWSLASELFGGDKRKNYVLKMDVAENSTLEDLIGSLSKNYPALDRALVKTDKNELLGTSMYVSVILNDQLINSTKGYQVKLQDGDRVLFVQGFSGG
jgi:molybdopterin converting factor small subunit